MRKLNALAAILTIVGGLNWGLVGLFKFDLVAAVLGGMPFGEVNVASRVVYTLVGLSAAYLATQVPALVRASPPTHASAVRSWSGSRKGSGNVPSPQSSTRRRGRSPRHGPPGRRLQQQRRRHRRERRR